MDWKDVAGAVAKSAPMLGGLLAGPPGAAVGAVGAMVASAFGVGSSPDEVSQALVLNPDAAVKLKEIEKSRQVELQGLIVQVAVATLAAETAAIQAVNTTMQAEVKAEHWASWFWRPYNGLIFGTTFFGVYFVLPVLKLPVPTIPFEAWAAMGAVLGVASFYRGKAQANVNHPAQVVG